MSDLLSMQARAMGADDGSVVYIVRKNLPDGEYRAVDLDNPLTYPKFGVPISYLDKHDPEQFEIIELLNGNRTGVNGKLKYARIIIRPTRKWMEQMMLNHE